jgi:hypothetical protein
MVAAVSSTIHCRPHKNVRLKETGSVSMKREALIRELRGVAARAGAHFAVIESKGKGSHYRVEFGERWTTIKAGELKPGYIKLVKRQLGLK